MKKSTVALLAAALLIGAVALAQSTSQLVFKTPTASSGPIQLWVDQGGGSDNADCSQPQRACKSIAGSFAKLPDFVNHAVTITLRGTFTENPMLKDKTFGSRGSLTLTSLAGSTVNGLLGTQNVTGLNADSLVVKSSVFFTSGTPFFPTPVVAPNASLVLYVDGNVGKDTNLCTDAGPCATHQRALAVSPKTLRGGVTIKTAHAADGGQLSYPCMIVSGFHDDFSGGIPFDGGAGTGGLLIDGDLVPFYTDGGVNSSAGLAFAVTAGSGNVGGTLQDTKQTWASNVFQGYLLNITTGTGTGKIFPISSNTSNTITIDAPWGAGAPVADSGYAVVMPGWTIATDSCSLPAIGSSGALTSQGAIFITGNELQWRAGALQIRNFGIGTPAARNSTTAVVVDDSSSLSLTNFMLNSSSGVIAAGIPNATPRVNMAQGSYTGSATGYAAQSNSGSFIQLTNILSYGSNAGLYNNVIASTGTPMFSIVSSDAENVSVAAVNVTTPSDTRNVVQTSRITCASSSADGIVVGGDGTLSHLTSWANAFGSGVVYATGNVFDPTCGIGIVSAGPTVVWEDTSTTLDGGPMGTSGYLVSWGGRINHLSGSNLFGTTQDVSFDNSTFVANLDGGISASSCNISDGGVSKYASKFCIP